MLHHKKLIGFLAGLTALLMAGCYKDKTVPVDTTQEITTPVSFAADIIPIFSKSCALSGCHNTGGHVPDLTAANAFRTLNEESLIDAATPKNSELYGWLTGTIKPAMPLGASANPSNINALVLAWITQGAKNN